MCDKPDPKTAPREFMFSKCERGFLIREGSPDGYGGLLRRMWSFTSIKEVSDFLLLNYAVLCSSLRKPRTGLGR